MARPTDYTPALIAKARKYEKLKHKIIPSIAGLALYLDIARDTCHTWAKEKGKEEFSDIYRRIMTAQENTLVNKGLSGDFNPTITKLILTKHGYTDKQDITSDDKPISPLLVKFIDGKDSGDPARV